MKESRDFLNTLLRVQLAELNLQANRFPPVEAIEQVVGRLILQNDKNRQENPSSLALTLTMIRTVNDFDWKEQMRAAIPKLVEIKHGDNVYFMVPKEVSPFLGGSLCFCVPDRRTIVIDSEETMRRILDRKPGEKPAQPWAESWKRFEGATMVMLYENGDGRCQRVLAEREKPEKNLLPFYENADRLILYCDLQDKLRVGGWACNATDAGTKKLHQACLDLMDQGLKAMNTWESDKHATPEEKAAEEFLKQVEVGVLSHEREIEIWGDFRENVDIFLNDLFRGKVFRAVEERTPEKKP